MKWQLHVLHRIELPGQEHKFAIGKYLKECVMWHFHCIFSSFTWRECEEGTDRVAVKYRRAE
jgi:hypothetical protein